MKTLSSVNLRKDLGGVLTEAGRSTEEIVITRSGKPVAVLIGIARWEEIESILATWEQMQDPKNKKKLRAAKTELATGRVLSHEEIVTRCLHRRSA
ncbi:MAG TPA: type II toxin-antitoxin system Phd/YefM family antitoxin [Candidatus Binatia bacterium]|nr:type II toxin-antitoxin system Phd/YefM family antitoxin [Candidatus Binatia bacterium]